jgi:pyruvate formate lyase activating enzyme
MRSGLPGVVGWQKNSFIDYPGTVATVLFFSGCNLACPYCHNPHVVNASQSQALASDDIWEFLEKRKGMIEGVVLSGGEPTLHACILAAAPAMKRLGYRVKLDTNGLQPEVAAALAPDYLALDVKTSPRLYGPLLSSPYGDTRQRLCRSIDMVRALGDNAEVRITVAPGIVDREIIREVGGLIRGVNRVFLQPMMKKGPLLDPAIAEKEPVPAQEIALFRDILSEFVGQCTVRGE